MSHYNILRICHKQCDQCLYSSRKIVTDTRRNEIMQDLEEDQDYFICHKASIADKKVMCRGYYEANKSTSLLIKLGTDLGVTQFVDVMEIMKESLNRSRSGSARK